MVEVKRSTDTRLRRELVGQMLDYAANAVVYWPLEEIRSRFVGRCEAEGLDPAEELAAFLGEDGEVAGFGRSSSSTYKPAEGACCSWLT